MVYYPQAFSDRIFIRLDKEEIKTNVILTDTTHRQNVGTVISIGPLVRSVAIGDKVVFHLFDDLPSHAENVVVIREKSLLGKLLPVH
ncbi:MAG: hypothetical protein IKZ02_07285 [Alphaproteobacteria bacterium]|nr:hypothetical protein [Alphaproteobacteria bacterium]